MWTVSISAVPPKRVTQPGGQVVQDQHPCQLGCFTEYHACTFDGPDLMVHVLHVRFTGPISASVSLSTDQADNVWAFFGTGRYQSTADKMDESQQYFFGVKDPYFNADHENGTAADDYYLSGANTLEVDTADLFDAGLYSVHTNRTVTGGAAAVTDWNSLLKEARGYDGWYHPLQVLTGNPSERVISKATALGGIIFFPGYTPNDDICGFGGDTAFYADYYETGTAYYKHILPGYHNDGNRGWGTRY
jgi:Tfp pilus tip-associated adhesin PilY1